jgi:hypothetical protein
MKQISIAAGFVWIMFCISFGMASVGDAAQCLDPSPTISSGRKFTDPISARELTATENQQLTAVLKSLEGRWQGDATEVTCNLADIEDQDIDAFTMKAKVRMDRSGDFLMEAEFHSAKEHTRHQKTLRFYLNEQFIRIHHDNGTGDVELIEVSENQFQFRYLIRVKNRGNAGGIYLEFFYRITTADSGFSIHQEIYTQGRLSGQSDWKLRHE